MIAKAHQRKNTLRRFTNGDSFQTFDQQWAISQEASVVTLCQILHCQWLNLFTIIPSPRKFAKCLYYNDDPFPILPVLSHLVESIYLIQYIHSYKLHSYIHRSILSYIHICTHSCVHSICTISIHTWLH